MSAPGRTAGWPELSGAAAFLEHAAAFWAARAEPDVWFDYVPRELRVVLHELQGYGRALGGDERAVKAEEVARWLGRASNHVDVRELAERLERLRRLVAARTRDGEPQAATGSVVPATVGAHVVAVDRVADPALAGALAARQVNLVAVPPEKAQILRMARWVRPQLLLLRPALVGAFLAELCETLRDDPRLVYREIWLWADPAGGASTAAIRAGATGIVPPFRNAAELAALLAAMAERVGHWRAAAVVDPLTALHSMAYFRARFRAELARQTHRGGRLAVLAVRARGSDAGRTTTDRGRLVCATIPVRSGLWCAGRTWSRGIRPASRSCCWRTSIPTRSGGGSTTSGWLSCAFGCRQGVSAALTSRTTATRWRVWWIWRRSACWRVGRGASGPDGRPVRGAAGRRTIGCRQESLGDQVMRCRPGTKRLGVRPGDAPAAARAPCRAPPARRGRSTTTGACWAGRCRRRTLSPS